MKVWRKEMQLGLPADFDYSVIRTAEDAETLIENLPNSDRGTAALALYEQRHLIGKDIAFAGMMNAFDHDHAVMIKAFQTTEDLAYALRDVAPPLKLSKPLRVWRGVQVPEHCDARGAAFGMSWTGSRAIAYWVATRFACRPDDRCFVFQVDLRPETVLLLWNGRREQEVIVDPAILREHIIRVDGSNMTVEDLPYRVPNDLANRWRLTGDHYEQRKKSAERTKLKQLRPRRSHLACQSDQSQR
jgi:hypothetical protein